MQHTFDIPTSINNMKPETIGLEEGPICPLPFTHNEVIVMGHGSGGKMSHDLIKKYFYSYFENELLLAGNDAAVINIGNATLAFSTDSHVVKPLFFPGGDIGRLAVCGTVNDVSMMGAVPLYLSAGFILEEGFEIITLSKILESMRTVAEEAGIQIVTGDTKVVQKNQADGIYINTTGVGLLYPGSNITGSRAQPGDAVILSGSIGEHGLAVLEARGELGFSSGIQSDVAPLNRLVRALIDAVPKDAVHVLRDPTRGGLATSLNEIAQQSRMGIIIDENKVTIQPAVRSVCELLGFDPMYVANEGKLICIVEEEFAHKALMAMHNTRYGENAAIIGYVANQPQGRVLMTTTMGSTRILDMLSGEMLPRIC